MEIISLASGSKGNCWYLNINGKNVLIDVGISMKQINIRLMQYVGIDLEDIDLVFITHRHIDHVRSLHTILKTYDNVKFVAPKVVFNEYTKEFKHFIPKTHRIELTEDYTLNGNHFDVMNIKINHDVSTFAYKFIENGSNDTFMFIADNGGILKNYIIDKMKNCTYYAIESNHDLTQQIFSQRDTLLKRRVLSYYGHTHNAEAINLAFRLITSKTKGIIFHHLSHECNTEELARATHNTLIEIWGKKTEFRGVDIKYARQDEVVTLV